MRQWCLQLNDFDAFGQLQIAGSAALIIGSAVVVLVAFSWIWGRHWKLGALSGIALLFFTVQVVLVLFALVLYFGVERLVELLFVKQSERNPILTRNL